MLRTVKIDVLATLTEHCQWRIQDFPEGGGGRQSGYANLSFRKNCMKMKEFGPGGTSLVPPDPPMIAYERFSPITLH